MSADPETPARREGTGVFVERATYRRRRLGDAARLLPILGAVLFVVPLLWSGAGADPADPNAMKTSSAMIYLFSSWVALIGLAFLFGLSARFWSLFEDHHGQKPPG